MNGALNLFSPGSGYGEIVGSLQIQPELRGGIEISGKTQRGVGCDSSTPVDNLGYSRGWHTQFEGKFVDAHLEWLQVVLSNCLSRMRKRDFIVLAAIHYDFSSLWRSVVVGNLDIESVPFLPSKTDPVLIVDTNTILARSISLQRLQPICWRRCKVPQLIRTVDLNQLSECDLGNPLESPDSPLPKDRFSVFVPKRTDQTTIILRPSLYGKRMTASGSQYPVERDQIQRRRIVSHGSQKSRHLSAVVGPVIYYMK
jgi:hypothetical protein